MLSIVTGQKLKLSEVTSETDFSVRVFFVHPDIDISCFGLNSDRQLEDDKYFVFYNQISSPHQEIVRTQQGINTEFSIKLTKLPKTISRLVFAATSDSLPIVQMQSGEVRLEKGDQTLLSYALNNSSLENQKAVMAQDRMLAL